MISFEDFTQALYAATDTRERRINLTRTQFLAETYEFKLGAFKAIHDALITLGRSKGIPVSLRGGITLFSDKKTVSIGSSSFYIKKVLDAFKKGSFIKIPIGRFRTHDAILLDRDDLRRALGKAHTSEIMVEHILSRFSLPPPGRYILTLDSPRKPIFSGHFITLVPNNPELQTRRVAQKSRFFDTDNKIREGRLVKNTLVKYHPFLMRLVQSAIEPMAQQEFTGAVTPPKLSSSEQLGKGLLDGSFQALGSYFGGQIGQQVGTLVAGVIGSFGFKKDWSDLTLADQVKTGNASVIGWNSLGRAVIQDRIGFISRGPVAFSLKTAAPLKPPDALDIVPFLSGIMSQSLQDKAFMRLETKGIDLETDIVSKAESLQNAFASQFAEATTKTLNEIDQQEAAPALILAGAALMA
ncbi:MAG: hypothetical protein ACYS1A_16870 [Planctomycetota bacterium]|jgi:hypothetical protein